MGKEGAFSLVHRKGNGNNQGKNGAEEVITMRRSRSRENKASGRFELKECLGRQKPIE